jgi:hypothetical protein
MRFREILLSVFVLLFSSIGSAQCPPPGVTSPITVCQNTTASPLTAIGTNLVWGGENGSVGGTATFNNGPIWEASDFYNNRKTNISVSGAVKIISVDYSIPSYQSVNNLVIGIFNNGGTLLASSQSVTLNSGSSATKITALFNYTIPGAGNYSIGVASGSGNLGYDSPSYPITGSGATISITGVSHSNYRCFNNICFAQTGSTTAPVPNTSTAGTQTYTVTQTVGGCTSTAATITVNVNPTGGSAPSVTSPVNLCLNSTASPLTATGTNLSWGGGTGSVGGTNSPSSYTWVASDVSNNKKTTISVLSPVTINSVDYFITSYQSVSNLVLGIFDNSGNLISTSGTSTTQSGGASGVKITAAFNASLNTGTYSIGVVSGSGNIAYDSPSFPVTETTGSINITGVTNSGICCFNNIQFSLNRSSSAPTPSTETAGTTNYYVTQTVNGCLSPAATITVIVGATGGAAPTVTSPVNYCQNSTASPLTAMGSNLLWSGVNIPGVVGGNSALTNAIWVANNASNNRKTNFATYKNNVVLTSVDFYIPAYQAVSGLSLAIFSSEGTVLATSQTITQSSGASATKITATFNYTLAAAGSYAIGISAGSGNIGYDNPSLPITEATSTMSITGITHSGNRCFNNFVFANTTSSTAPTPSTTSLGSTTYYVSQVVNGCVSPSVGITVNVSTGATATLSYTGSPFCGNDNSEKLPVVTGFATGTFSSSAGLHINNSNGAINPSLSTAGTYTINYAMNNGGCTSNATASVTINPVNATTINYAGSPYCSGGGTATVTRSGTAGGSFSSTSGLSINATTGAVNLAASVPGTYTVTYTMNSNGSCAAAQASTTVIIGLAGTWTGAVNDDFTNAANWLCGQIPNSNIDVVINAGCPHFPELTTTASLDNLTINPGASFTISGGGQLNLSGNLVNNGTMNAVEGAINLNGTHSQNFNGTSLDNKALKKLIISNSSSAGVTLTGALDIYGSFEFSGTGRTFNTGDLLTLKSNASGTAYVGIFTGNNFNGKVTVERYLPAKKAWYFLSVPTVSGQTIKQAWQEGATSSALNPVAGFGTQLTSNRSTWQADGFDTYSAGGPSIKKYVPANNSWAGLANTISTTISTTDGYMVFVRGDRSATAVTSPVTSTVMRSTGNLLTGSPAAINVSPNLFAAIGNPYASAIDMRQIGRTNIKNFFYVWDPKLAGASGYGGYQTFSYTGNNYVVTPGGGSYGANGSVCNVIAAGQAFFVQANAGGGSIQLNENCKSAEQGFAARTTSNPGSLTVDFLGMAADHTDFTYDGVMINYSDENSNNIDENDALKWANSAENLGIKRNGASLVVERRQTFSNADTIQLSIGNVRVQNYKFRIQGDLLDDASLTVYVEDKYLHSSMPVNSTNNEYNFNVANVPGSYTEDRFRIIIIRSVPLPVTFVTVSAKRATSDVLVNWSVAEQSNVKDYEIEKSLDGTNFKMVGTVTTVDNQNKYAFKDLNTESLAIFYRIKSVDVDGKTGYSNIVKVVAVSEVGSISLANTKANGFTLKTTQLKAGNYSISVVNMNGQVVFKTTKQILPGMPSVSIQMNTELAAGIYEVVVEHGERMVVTGKW